MGQSSKYVRISNISLLFLIILSSCAKSNKEPTNLEKFLKHYELVYPEGYKFENGYYNLLSFDRKHYDKSTTFRAENYNISGEFSLRFETTPFYDFSLNNMKLRRYLVYGAGTTIPYEQHEEIFWDGDNLYNKYQYNAYIPSDEVWTENTYGTDQVDNVFIKSRISNIDGVIRDVKYLLETKNKDYLFVKHADFFDNTLSVYYSNFMLNKTLTIHFDEDLKFVRYQIINNFMPLYLNDENSEITQVLRPISEIDVAVPTEYEEDFIVDSNTLKFDLFYSNL